MADETLISWCDKTWSPWTGCTRVSPACDGCYAANLMDNRMGRVEWGAPGKGAGTRDRMSESYRNKPLAWNRQAAKAGTRPTVFPSLCDPFDNAVPKEWRGDFFDLIRATPNLIWLLLTKRPGNIVKMSDAAGGLPPNAAIGTTVEDQPRADTNLPALKVAKIELKPLFTFGSFEPLLGRVHVEPEYMPDWVITGGETDQGPHKARPSHPDWFRDLRDQAAAAGVPFHFKQWGEWTPGENVPHTIKGRRESAHYGPYVGGDEWLIGTTNMSDPEDGWDDEPDLYRIGKKAAGRMLDGIEHNAFPEVTK